MNFKERNISISKDLNTILNYQLQLKFEKIFTITKFY